MATPGAPPSNWPLPAPYTSSSADTPTPEQLPYPPTLGSTTAPTQTEPASSKEQVVTPARNAQTFGSRKRVGSISINALNWAERKTREASGKHLERQLATVEAGGATAYRAVDDPREPRYLLDRRVRFAQDGQAE